MGLAGARVGYLVVPAWLARHADAARLPLPIGVHSEALALAALADPAEARARQRLMVAERARMAAALASDGWRVLPSVTNFFLARPPLDARTLATGLAAEGLIVRAYWADHVLGMWLRIGARTRVENDRLLAALGRLRGSRD